MERGTWPAIDARMWIKYMWTQDFAALMFDPGSETHRWLRIQSCMYSPENEEAHRPTALSDCIPGFLLVHIVCMQKHLLEGRPQRSLDYAAELMRLLPFGINCLDSSGWPFTSSDVLQYYRRFRRGYAALEAYRPEATGVPGAEDRPLPANWPTDVLKEMAWEPPKVDPDDTTMFAGYGMGSRLQPSHMAGVSGVADGMERDRSGEDDVCPVATLPDGGVCWMMGPVGLSCREACAGANLDYRWPWRQPRATLTPRILALTQTMHILTRQHPWAAFECYVPDEGRFHMASPERSMGDGSWSYFVCSLACPCTPDVPPAIVNALEQVPLFPEDELV